jgi:hypothetical protein
VLAPLDIAIMTILDSYHASELSSARHRQAWLGRTRDRAIAALPLLAFIGVAGAVLFLRIWLYLPPLPR